MINKRLLIKNLLAHNSENSFYDKKRQINLETKEGKAKFLKHICALSNSNPLNRSFVVIGVEDEDNAIIGVDFYDDSKIQNLVNAYLENPPSITYENIPFPHLPDDLVVGLVTILADGERICRLKKNIWKYRAGETFYREGSISLPIQGDSRNKPDNSGVVASIEAHSQNNIALTLDGVFDFFQKHQDLDPRYQVFKEYFVLCWSGKKKKVSEGIVYSRLDIALINEQVKLFYSELDEVSIRVDMDRFSLLEYVRLGFNGKFKYYPLEEVDIVFKDNASYEIKTNLVFKAPQFPKRTLHHIYNANAVLLEKLRNSWPLEEAEERDLLDLPTSYLLCYFNGFPDAVNILEDSKELLKIHGSAYQQYKETMRILRKIKYN